MTGLETADISECAREQAPGIRRLLNISAQMYESLGADDVLRLAMESVPALGTCWAEGGYLVSNEKLLHICLHRPPDQALDSQVKQLTGAGGSVTPASGSWGWAFRLGPSDSVHGYLVVASNAQPASTEFALLTLLVHQTSAALAHAAQRRSEREYTLQMRKLTILLAARITESEYHRAVDEALTAAVASGDGENGIVRTVHKLTGFPVVLEDQSGNPRTRMAARPQHSQQAPGKGADADQPQHSAPEREPVRHDGRLAAVVRPRNEILGAIALVDPSAQAGPREAFILERAAAALASELTHDRNRAEVEERLQGALLDDLIAGTDEPTACARADTLGHTLHRLHYVTIVEWSGTSTDNTPYQAVRNAAGSLGIRPLLTRRSAQVVLLSEQMPGEAFYHALAHELRPSSGAIGVGGRCDRPVEFPRSFRQAVRALHCRQTSDRPHGLTAFDNLGIYRILNAEQGDEEIDLFLHGWLGPLIDYDTKHHCHLITTLSKYLECSGNYDAAAAGLAIHRSTLRYRLQRIREITGLDLRNVENWLNLHVATRLWKMRQTPP